MIRRLYVHNHRCFLNTELDFGGRSQVLIVGRNGAGKTSLLHVLTMLRDVAGGRNRVAEVVSDDSLTGFSVSGGDDAHPTQRFEIDGEMTSGKRAAYALALELPADSRAWRVLEESLVIADQTVYTRSLAEVTLNRAPNSTTSFPVDSQQVALPVIGAPTQDHPVEEFRRWLRGFVLLGPVPSLMGGESVSGTPLPAPDCHDYAAWFREVTTQYPATYAVFLSFLKRTLPDLESVQNRPSGRDARSLEYVFRGRAGRTYAISFQSLSDGERCLSVAAVLAAMSAEIGPQVCFWDEPDNFIGLGEVGHLIRALRRSFRDHGQLIVTSHNPEAIRAFSQENSLLIYRTSSSEPARCRPVTELGLSGDLADTMARGDEMP